MRNNRSELFNWRRRFRRALENSNLMPKRNVFQLQRGAAFRQRREHHARPMWTQAVYGMCATPIISIRSVFTRGTGQDRQFILVQQQQKDPRLKYKHTRSMER